MLLIRFLNAIAGYREMVCPAACGAEVLSLLVEGKLDYWDVRREEETLSFCLLEREYRQLRRLAGELPLTTHRRRGLPQWLARHRRRLGVPLGFVIFLLLTHLSTQYVWDVTVSGNETLTDAEVQACLEELGCGVGSHIPSVDYYAICHQFLLANEKVAWISVNMVGTTARVELIEADSKSPLDDGGNGTPSNLLAARPGVIVRTETASGMTVVEAGQTVTEGQLLVSGVVDVGRNEEEGRFRLVRSRARVFARTERRLEVVVPYETVKRTPMGRKTLKKSLKFFGKSIKLEENSSILYEGCDIIKEDRRIVLFEGDTLTGGIPLPVSIVTESYEIYAETAVRLTEEEAMRVAVIEMSDLFSQTLPDAEILTRTVTVEERETEAGRALVLAWEITCIEDIARESLIGVK